METCKRPFIREDLTAYDLVADGRLYLEEVNEEQLDCLVEHLIRTKDDSIRYDFYDLVQNDLWEAIQDRLHKLEEQGGQSEDVQARISDLLQKEYSDDEIFFESSFAYSYGLLRRNTSFEGGTSAYRLNRHTLSASGAMDGKFNLGRWKLMPSADLTGKAFWFDETQSSGQGLPPEVNKNKYWGLSGDGSISALTRDESINLGLYGQGQYYETPPPGNLEDLILVGGQLSLREIGHTPFSFNADGSWSKLNFSEVEDELFDPRTEIIRAYGEASYMLEKVGLLASYLHRYEDDVQAIIKEETNQDSGTLNAHIDFDGGFVGTGAGGGYWSETSRQIQGDGSESEGGEAHGNLSAMISPAAPLQMNFGIAAAANKSEGTFEGWYPSYLANISGRLSFSDISLKAGAWMNAVRKDLNEYQNCLEYEADLELLYMPKDFFNIDVLGSYGERYQDGYEAYQSNKWEGTAQVKYRLIADLNLWLGFMGNLTNSSYDIDGVANIRELDASINTYLSMRY